MPQFPLIRDAVRAFNVACIEQEGFEADDIIATYARQAAEAGAEVVIVSSDKDLMQLIEPGVSMLDTMKNKTIGEPEVIEKFGVTPDKVVDVQALAGDSTDNVPGVPGIGIKTAAELIREYGDLETLLAKAPLIKQKMRRERLIEFADQARLSQRLVELEKNVPVAEPLDSTAVEEPDPHALLAFLRTMEFNSLTKRISEAFGVEPPAPGEAVHAPAPAPQQPAPAETKAEEAAPANGPAQELRRVMDWLRPIPFNHGGYTQVTDLQTLEDWIAAATEQGFVAFDTETTDLDAVAARLCGVSLALEPNRACYIPLAHRPGDGLDFSGVGQIAQLPLEQAIPRLKALLEDESVLEDRPEHQIRPRGDAPLWRAARALRRHDAAGLFRGPGPRRAGGLRHGRAVEAPSRAHAHCVRRCGRQGQDAGHVRLRAGGQGHRICRRGRRCHAAALVFVQGAARSGGHGRGLRDA